ncbi:MAG: hypothetical protein H0W81_04595 [Chloroflexi bacterium]|nr:hypothetical protein [Chloroflexota bacterium]
MALPPTAGIRLKILRALHDLDEIHVEEGNYLRPDPHTVRFEFYEEKGERRARALLVIREPAPPGLGVLAGEAAYHLRGALDHLVYQLALLNVRNPSGTQFPLCLDERAYRTVPPGKKRSPRDSMLRGLREEHRAIIDEFQPYHDGERAKLNPLYVVGKFANADKHRTIQAAFGRPDQRKVVPWEDGIELDVRFPDLKPPINEGAELFNVRVVEGYPNVPMNYSIRFTVAYGTGRPDDVSHMYLVEAGERIHNLISEIEDRVPALKG